MASVEMGNMSSREGERVDMLPNGKPEDWMEYFQFRYSRDTASDARNALLVVAALLVQVTYQAGINPPAYIYKNDAGKDSPVYIIFFLMVNTLSFSAAMTMIEYLTANMPYQRETRISICCMAFGYGWAAARSPPINATKTTIIIVSSVVPYLVRSLPYLYKKCCY